MAIDYYRDCWIFNGQVRTVTRTTETGMHVRGWGDGHLAWRGHDDDLAYLDGLLLDLTGKVKGNFPIAFDLGGIAHVQFNPGDGVLARYTLSGIYIGYVPAPYAAEGCHHIEFDGRIVMGNDPSLRRVMPNGELWHQVIETEHFICGQYGRDPDYGGSLSLFNKRTAKVQRWLGYTPHPPRMVELDGVPTIAISGRDTPEPHDIQWVDAFPALPPAPTPELPAIEYPQTVRPIFRGCLGWDGGPGNFAGARNGGDRPIVEGSAPGWIRPEDEPKLIGIHTSSHESQAPLSDAYAAVELAKRTGAAVLSYADRPFFDLWVEINDYAEKGVTAIPAIRCYPTEPDDTVDTVMLRLDVDLSRQNYRGPVAIVRPLYAQAHWSEVETARLNLALTERIESEPRIVMDLAFGWKRPQGSKAFKDWVETYFAGLCERTPTPARDTLPRTVKPGETPAPVPEPVIPKPEPVKAKAESLLEHLRQRKAELPPMVRDTRPWWKKLLRLR